MSEDGCSAVVFVVVAAGFTALVYFGNRNDLRRESIARGRAIQFCIDHGGQWDDANVRCLKVADTITVQVPK